MILIVGAKSPLRAASLRNIVSASSSASVLSPAVSLRVCGPPFRVAFTVYFKMVDSPLRVLVA